MHIIAWKFPSKMRDTEWWSGELGQQLSGKSWKYAKGRLDHNEKLFHILNAESCSKNDITQWCQSYNRNPVMYDEWWKPRLMFDIYGLQSVISTSLMF